MEMSFGFGAAAADSPGGGGIAVAAAASRPSRYESQKRRDWRAFGEYLRNHRPPLALDRCSGAHVLEFMRYLDQFGKTKVHAPACPFFGVPAPPAPCQCPLKQAWGSLDALVGRLRAAYEEDGGKPDANPFAARAIRLYLREVRDCQAKARGIAYDKKRRRRRSSAKNKQANSSNKVQQDSHQAPAAAPASAEPVVTEPHAEQRTEVPDLEPHFFIPHNLFFQGHFLAPLTEAAAAAEPGLAPAVGSTTGGDDMVLGMAEAHAAGCMLPLSVFR